jgi:hypothetical protein
MCLCRGPLERPHFDVVCLHLAPRRSAVASPALWTVSIPWHWSRGLAFHFIFSNCKESSNFKKKKYISTFDFIRVNESLDILIEFFFLTCQISQIPLSQNELSDYWFDVYTPLFNVFIALQVSLCFNSAPFLTLITGHLINCELGSTWDRFHKTILSLRYVLICHKIRYSCFTKFSYPI